jgi:hypothetical protein
MRCGIWDVGCGIWDVGCGIRELGDLGIKGFRD